MSGDVFVYFQKNTDVAIELLCAARELVGEGHKVCAIVLREENGEHGDICEKELFEGGADKIYYLTHKKLGNYNPDYFSKAIVQLIEAKSPYIVLFGATHEGRELAPRVSVVLGTGLVADCTKLEMTDYKGKMRLAATRPTFGGQLMATILCKTNPQMATVRENVLPKLKHPYESAREKEEFGVNLDNASSGVRFLEFIENLTKGPNTLDEAKIILSGGLGLKREGFLLIEKIVKALNDKGLRAAVGASRKAVDKGFAPYSAQIGQTGRTVTPKVYVALGISGAVQHITGMQNSGCVIAVNNDPNAPIFENCNFGIVKDAHKVLEEMAKELGV